jgi:carotenoid 1,2-hydratase
MTRTTKIPEKHLENFQLLSSLSEDAWHPSDDPKAYEWWYFDSISDDSRYSLVIIFLSNFVFSPRYNANCQKNNSEAKLFPAVAFVLYQDDKPLYRAINEFPHDQFSARTDFPSCNIGENDFKFEATPYGIRFLININANLRGQKQVKASFEWLIIERDFLSGEKHSKFTHFWNVSSPRADVTGKIYVYDRKGKQIDAIQFRGTGYHDHNLDNRWMPQTVKEWQWGRAHFSDTTAVFYRYWENNSNEPITKLCLIQNNSFTSYSADFQGTNPRRNIFGLKYNSQLIIEANDKLSFQLDQSKVIDSSFFYLRFLGEAKLDLGDGKLRQTLAVSEQLNPHSLRWRWLDWLVNMRIGLNGKSAFLP